MTGRRWLVALGLVLGLGCGSGKTTAHCGAACDIWANCAAWDRAACMAACESDGDWDQAYVNCLQAQTCETLDACG
jgi:hypothetical protein